MSLECVEESNYDKQRAAMKKELAKLNKVTKSKVVSTMVKEKEVRNDNELQGKIMLARDVFRESIEMVNEGDMTFDNAMKELSELLIKI